MSNDRVFAMSFAGVYPLYVNKAVGKGRKEEVVTNVFALLTGYTLVRDPRLSQVRNLSWVLDLLSL